MAWFSPLICLHITFFLIILEMGHATIKDRKALVATAPGDLIIGGIFPFHEDVEGQNISFVPQPQPCIRFRKSIVTRALAMINAIDVMNKSPLLSVLNITLGYQLRDSCSDVSTALRATADFIHQADCSTGSNTPTCQPLMTVIGASHSETSIAIARQLTLNMIPQISYSSTAAILSDKRRFPAFLRTVPNDQHQTAAMVSLLSNNGWNWVGVVTTDGDYGRSALEHFVSQASEKGICVAFKSILPQSVSSQDTTLAVKLAAATIHRKPKVQVIVSFAKATHMMYLYQELKSQLLTRGHNVESMRRVWVASDAWSSSSSVRGNLTLNDIGHVVGFTFKNGDISSFMEYLSRLEAVGHGYTNNNSFLQQLYLQLNTSNSSGDADLLLEPVKTLKDDTEADIIFSMELAVSATAQAVASICRNKDCKKTGSVKPWEVLEVLRTQEFKLRERSYKFDSGGDINLGYDVTMWTMSDGGNISVHDVVAEYDTNTNNFTYSDQNSAQQFLDLKNIISKCSNSCVPGQFKKTSEGQHTCCYECSNCTENYYSNQTDMDHCLTCDTLTEWSPAGSSSCRPKAVLFFSWQDGFAVVLLTFSALGIVLVLMVSALFLHQRNTPVVKAAGGPLSQVVLFSLVVSYISAMLFVGQPNSFQCKARQVLFGISFTLCVSCILVKTLQILLAFQFNPELQEVLRRLYQPYVIVSICIALQAVICTCWLVLKSPSNHTIRQPTALLEDCDEGSYVAFGVMLGYIAVLAFVCFICAFKGRKLPQHYNEAKFITFSMLLYLISWLIFVPVYVTTSGVYLPAVEMVVILISNYGILSCHFFPKCYVILFKKEQNTKSAFRKNLYDYSGKTTELVSACGSSVSGQQPTSQLFVISTVSHFGPPADPFKPVEVTNCRDTPICLHTKSLTQRCLRRSTSV